MKYALILSITAIGFFGCQKKQDTLVEITVKNDVNQVVPSATVKLSTLPPHEQNSTPVLEMEGTTNAAGIVRFNFNDVYQLGQAGVAVLNVDVQKDALTGQGIIKVEQEVTSEETVFVQ